MANLIVNTLINLSIGTQVKLTYAAGDELITLRGTVEDNDYESSLKIRPEAGEPLILNYSLVLLVQETKTIKALMAELQPGSRIRFSYGDLSRRKPDTTGVVLNNDYKLSLQIRSDRGEEMILAYSLIHSLLVLQAAPERENPIPAPTPAPAPTPTPAPVPRTPLYKREPEDCLSLSDSELQDLSDRLPREERMKLDRAYNSFKHGVKVNDKDKLSTAANGARKLFLEELQGGRVWSSDGARFCAALLCRANLFDPQILLAARRFQEAALAAYRTRDWPLAGACALLALLESKKPGEDMLIILSASTVQSDDASGLRLLRDRLPEGFESSLRELQREALAFKGARQTTLSDVSDSTAILDSLYPGQSIAKEALRWLNQAEAPAKEEASAKDNVSKEETSEPESPVESTPPAWGYISKLQWVEHTGTIVRDDGDTFSFRYADISDPPLLKIIQNCLKSNLNGKTYFVYFTAGNGTATDIRPDSTPADDIRTIFSDPTRKDRFQTAFALCRRLLGTPDTRRAVADLLEYAVALCSQEGRRDAVEEALQLYEEHRQSVPSNAFLEIKLAQCHALTGDTAQAIAHADKAALYSDLTARQETALMDLYLRVCETCLEAAPDEALQKKLLEAAGRWERAYQSEFTADRHLTAVLQQHILPARITALCALGMTREARADLARLEPSSPRAADLEELVRRTAAGSEPEAEAVSGQPEPDHAVSEEIPAQPQVPSTGEPASEEAPQLEEDDEEDEEEIKAPPYQDRDGWAALGLTKRDVIDYALSIPGEQGLPAMLAYLRAGAALQPEIAPVYHVAALAANDPMEEPDYSITALQNALSESDPDYPQFTDCCMAAAFLRSSFQSGLGYDYSAQGLRSSIALAQKLPELHQVYNTLEEFRTQVGRAIDVYADYRNQNVKKLQKDLDDVVRLAGELYKKFILAAPRDASDFTRMVDTKKIVFAWDGYLAIMLRAVMDRDESRLEEEKESFAAHYLADGAQSFTARNISHPKIDAIISDSWDQTSWSKSQKKKSSSTLQGTRRNNLRSNISDMVEVVCRWYALSEESAGLTWRTELGESTYQRLKPQLQSQLAGLDRACAREAEESGQAEYQAGLGLLARTARELSGRLDGSWSAQNGALLYAGFLDSDDVMLDERFLPELSSTFCALPGSNILARIRRHVEGPRLGFQEHMDLIYGPDKTRNNYGTAQRLLEYLQLTGRTDEIVRPENSADFLEQTERQVRARFNSFLERYALATNYGQIMQSDAFCYTLEDTIKYWYVHSTETKNYGFFITILTEAEEQIHASARQYERQLDEQLDALIASNQQQFSEHPGYGEAIRTQIAQQNFIVAEDWMHRIRIGDFSMEVQKPDALVYLDQFWSTTRSFYEPASDSGRPLSVILERREIHNKDTKGARHLVDYWLSSGGSSNPTRIGQLLNQLGWKNIQVERYRMDSDPQAEVYHVSKEPTAGGTTPLHPIAAFGSRLERDGMFVVCLYGVHNCDRLFEKIRLMDALTGTKLILLDCALGGVERRALARKLKKRSSGLRNVYLVVDRMLIYFLSKNYNVNLVNQMLMAVGMPFSYYQPYVAESSLTMPPEIFIGRRDELQKIEDPEGVNLIYGGRQLGKSALFKKARSDIDGSQQRRALFVDIKDLDCAAAAQKLSAELIDFGILSPGEETDDWSALCRSIKRRLLQKENVIRYLLIMLDEADAFIEDCSLYNYKPLVDLKDVQQSLPGAFKFVLAGLHNIIRFNRDVALGRNAVITHFPSLKITPFHTPEAQELLTVPLSYLGFSLPSKVTVSQILATANYFPGLIQLYCQKLIESMRENDYAGYSSLTTPPYVVTDDHLRRVMADKDFVDQIHEKFEITLRLDQNQGSCYYPLALLFGLMYTLDPAKVKSGYSARDVLHHARDLGIRPLSRLDEEKVSALLQELQDLNILRSVGNDTYLLASKNFRDLLGSVDEIFNKLSELGGGEE